MFGYEITELIGRPLIDFVAPDSRKLVAERVSLDWEEAYEFRGLRKDGSTFPAESHARIGTWNGKRTRITALRDLTAYKEIEEKLQNQRTKLEQATRLALVSEVSAGIIHQIGQPICVIGAILASIPDRTDTGGKSSDDIRAQFAPGMRSMHPVTRPSTNVRRVSLVTSMASGGMMNCSDCHRSADPDGPRGPHGSMYEFMLSGNYTVDGTADESPLAYQFCYSCHERNSILGNESFPLHREHIVGDLIKGIPGTSCYTCHSSHSSRNNPYLIDFNRQVVRGTRIGGRIEYRSLGEKAGECYLNCHGREHDPARY